MNECATVLVIANAIIIGLGTKGKDVAAEFYHFMKRRGNNAGTIPVLAFDYTEKSSDGHPDLPAGKVVRSHYNKARVEKLRALGWLWNIPKAIWTNEEIISQNVGAGNQPLNGNIAFKIHYEDIKQWLDAHIKLCQNHNAQRKDAQKGGSARRLDEGLTVYVVCSTIGGTGDGSALPCFEAIRDLAEHHNERVRVVAFDLALGTIHHFNGEQAIDNQNTVAKGLAAAHLGEASNLQMPGSTAARGPLVHSVMINTNANDHGEISTLRDFVKSNAEFLYTVLCTPAGEAYRASVVDGDGGTVLDKVGMKAIGTTGSLSVINLDGDKILQFAAHRLAGLLLHVLVTASNALKIREYINRILRALNLLEGLDVSSASQFVLNPKDLGGVDASAFAQAAFQKALRGYRGSRRREEAARRLGLMEQRTIPETYAPKIRNQADTLMAEGWKGIQEVLAELDRGMSGPADRGVALEECQQDIGRCRAFNRQKLDRLGTDRQAVQRRVGIISERIAKNARRFWLWRWIFKLLLLRRTRHFEDDAARVITLGVQIAAHKALEERVYRPLSELLVEAARENQEVVSLLTECGHICTAETQNVLHKPATEEAPLGVELADAEYLDKAWPGLLEECNGLEELSQRLARAFRETYPSPQKLLRGKPEGILSSLLSAGADYFCAAVGRLNVMDAFNERYPTRDEQRAAVMLCVRESRGRLKEAEGEDSLQERWIKIVMAQSRNDLEHLESLLAESDTKWGTWKPALSGESKRISFCQQRAGISLASLYKDGGKNGNGKSGKSVRQRAEAGPDPVTALQPGLKPTKVDAEATLLKALLLEMVDANGGETATLQLNPDDEPFTLLGGAKMLNAMRRNYPQIVRIHWAWARYLTRDYKGFMKKLEDFRGNGKDVPATVRDAISAAAVERVAEEARELHRYFSAREDD
ncbi:hypothetical protein HS125_11425 [bacterium]|nr:hypothetical protein [bacterium]